MHTSNTDQNQLGTDIQEANKKALTQPELQLQERQKEIRQKLSKGANR